MKRIAILLSLLLLISFSLYSKGIDGITRITTNQNGSLIEINVFFSQPINPRTINTNSVFINGRPINQNVKFIYNREGTQLRFSIEITGKFSIQFINITTNSGNTITTDNIYLSGDSTWQQKKY